MDITSAVPTGRQIIQGYGDGGFRVGDVAMVGSVLVFPDKTRPWAITNPDEITIESLSMVLAEPPTLLVIGCGDRFVPPPQNLLATLKERGVALEWMDTGAACRTFNVLLTEDRAVTGALIAVE